MKPKLFIFGLGYVGQNLKTHLGAQYQVSGTTRQAGGGLIKWDGESQNTEINQKIAKADAILISIPPSEAGDLAYLHFGNQIKEANVKWLGYLSTTGVYGDHQGGIVNEATPLNAQNNRAKRRILAEQQFQSLVSDRLSINIFRLPGIYGHGRSSFDALIAGRAKRIDMRLKNGNAHFFCRAHVDDISQCLQASLEKPQSGINIYNIADDQPAPNQQVIEFAASIMNIASPILLSTKDANMSDMAKSFYNECKSISNDKIKHDLGIVLKHPNYQQGLSAIWHKMQTS